jgi:phosphoribosylamine--glycine ligase
MAAPTLPFMTPAHYEQACSIVERIVARLDAEGRHFSGVMNSGFFATAEGVKVIEFNARFGDPECMNIMSLFEGNWPEVMQSICARRLAAEDVPLREEASLVLYLVSPDYALRKGPPVEFALDGAALEREGCHVFFSSAVQTGRDTYRTVGTSRALALASTAPTLEQARLRLVGCAASVPALQWRVDVGDERYLNGLGRLVAARPSSGGESLLSNAI